MDFLKDSQKKKQFIFSYITFVINGMLALSIGSLLPFIREARGLDYVLSGTLVSLHSVGNFLSSFFAGTIAVAIGRKRTILIFNAFFATAFAMILLGNHNVFLILAFFMTGLARGATSNFCNLVINNLAPGKAGIINGLHAMFSVGAFLFPILLTVLTVNDAGNWIYACVFMLIMGILSWILYALIPVEEAAPATKEEKKSTFAFFKEPMFLMCTATLFFYLCVEQGVIGWMCTYFKDTGLLSATLSQITASVLWIMILAGRLTTVYLSSKTSRANLLRIMGCGLVVFFVLLMVSRSTPLIVLGIMGFGYSMAGIYPTTVSFSGIIIKKYPIAWSFMLTFASVGSITMPYIIGELAEQFGIFYGMSSIVAAVVIDMAFIFGMTAYVKRKGME